MNKHDYKFTPNIDEIWDSFDFKVVMCGMGDDTAMLIAELFSRDMEPDELVFCDTGSEFPHTYKFIEHLKKWSRVMEWSKVVVLRKLDKFSEPLSVISLCQSQDTLPAVAFGSKSCSMRFKTETADKYFNNHSSCHKAWGVDKKGVAHKHHTGKILRLIGINADESGRAANWSPQPKWVQAFPLIDWGIGEYESPNVDSVGLYYPGKSSCTVCPNMTHAEIAMLRDDYPEIYRQSLSIESKYRDANLKRSAQQDIFGANVYTNTTKGLGGLSGKTWEQMMVEYDRNPSKFKSKENKSCNECGH